ncbi:unnamed protein product, partial [Urochloa humidicola]
RTGVLLPAAVILVYASPARRFTSAYESTRCDEYVLLRPGSGDLILLVYSTIRQAGGEHTGIDPSLVESVLV